MAIAFVQASQSISGTSITLNGVTSGNTVVFTDVFAGGSFPIHITGIIDNMGNMYHQVSGAYVGDTTVDEQSDIWYASNVIGGNLTLTISYGSTVTLSQLWLGEFSDIGIIESGTNTTAASGSPVSPTFTPLSGSDLLITVIAAGSTSISINSPWITPIVPTHGQYPTAYYLPGTTGTFTATTTGISQDYCSSGAIFSTMPIILLLSDTQTSSDTRISNIEKPFSDTQISSDNPVTFARGLNLSDSSTSSDIGPQAFSIESNFIASNSIPIVEILTNELLPASTKVYYIIEE